MSKDISSKWTAAQQCILAHLRVCDSRGTDVRLNPLQFFRPKVWPRQSMNMKQWQWQVVQSYPFAKAAHINVLELRAILNYVRFRMRQVDKHGSRFLLIVDSQVCASVVSKGRSSSQQLNVLLRRMASLLLLGNMRVAVGWCHTEVNPADTPSRILWGRK